MGYVMEKKKFQVIASEEFMRALKVEAAKRGETMNDFAVKAIQARMDAEKKKAAK